jgi:dipeptidyl aminopeptidase/acylaminoacyl peptidase
MGAKQPWQDVDAYRKASPAYALEKVKTPMLIHVGENDARVPAAHAKTLHRALYRYVKVPVQLVVYPSEGHGLDTLKHRRAKLEWDAAWFDHYVLGKEIAPPSGE